MADSVVAQSWPLAGHGLVVLNVFHDKPSLKAMSLLAPVIAAIEEYQMLMADLYHPPHSDEQEGADRG